MSIVKEAMGYKATGSMVNKGTAKRAILSEVDRLGTPTIVWFLVKRHKVGLLFITNFATAAALAYQFINQ